MMFPLALGIALTVMILGYVLTAIIIRRFGVNI